MISIDKTAARIAAQLGRQEAARTLTAEQMADDALQLVQLGRQARASMRRPAAYESAVTAARTIAKRYGAQLIDPRGFAGVALGLRFSRPVPVAGVRPTVILG